uniref:Uncharacterized protein n=1 Tax=Oryza rufipogon TaxID=4529 RepID=A0A0E0QK58_ORYRU
MGCAVSKGAAVPSLAYEVTTTTSLSLVLAASAYSVLRSASMGAAVVRLDAYEDDGGDDGKKKAVAAARGGGECLSVVVGGGVRLRNIHRCLLFLVSWAVDASTSLGGGKAKTEARARARLRWDPNAAWPHICCNRTNRVNNTDLPATMTRSVFSKNAEASSKGKKFDTPTRVSRQKEAATDANLDDHGAESKR